MTDDHGLSSRAAQTRQVLSAPVVSQPLASISGAGQAQPAEVRRMIGYVPQLVSADGALTGYENLSLFAKLYDLPRLKREQRVADQLVRI